MIPQVILNGLVLGLTIALVAVGLSLIYGILTIVNVAHGEFYMFGAVIVFYAMIRGGMGYIEASIIAMVAVGLLGFGVERLVFRRFHGDLVGGCIAASALAIGFQNITWVIFGPRHQTIPSVVTGVVEIFGAIVAKERLLVVGVSLAAILGLAYFIGYTKLGKAMRAVTQDREAASTLGINVNRVCFLACGIATALAALAGSLLAPVFTISPAMGFGQILLAFIVVLIGGIGSIMGAFWASIIIGFQQSFTGSFIGPEWSMGIGFALAILVLIFRPTGLMGHRIR